MVHVGHDSYIQQVSLNWDHTLLTANYLYASYYNLLKAYHRRSRTY